ncbi:transcription factor [Ganoderma sinense ZZ0214-1]|uniref:Transcription factor n=1 Tax=Ganoderma sinense ZZ0214-1 TaxID=1077348 RepID=A0A2G8SLK6_9APHY|nr:transcription factor [Ganoderma sinense ZZ0214-1]
MSRSAADATSSAPSNPPDDRRRHKTPRRSSSTSPSRHTLPTHPHAVPGASSSSNIVSQDPPTTSSSRVPTPSAPAPASDPESSHRRRKRERSSPSGSSSQGDMADTEMEGGPSKPSTSESAPEGAPPKKKRTRTLTTPHQAAVLHALLAQSRFPTTQMREEVGRSIGLSARKVQNQRQKARRPRGQATTTSAPLTRPPQFGPFTNAPPGGAASDISPTAMTMHSGSSASADGFFPRGLGGMSEMPYGTAGPSSRGPLERFAPAHRDAYFPEEYGRVGAPSAQLAGPGIPGSSRRGLLDDPAWRRPAQGFPGPPSASASASAMEPPEMYRATARPGRPPGEQGPALTLSLPPVLATRIDTRRGGPGSSPVTPLSASAGAGPYPTLASLSALESSASAHRTRASDEMRRTFPPANVDFSGPRGPPLNIPPPFTLQPRPLWDDPAFSPYNRGRRSSPPTPSFGESPTALHSPFGVEPLPSISAVVPLPVPVPMAAPAGPSPGARRQTLSTTSTTTLHDPDPDPDPTTTQTNDHHNHHRQHPVIFNIAAY